MRAPTLPRSRWIALLVLLAAMGALIGLGTSAEALSPPANSAAAAAQANGPVLGPDGRPVPPAPTLRPPFQPGTERHPPHPRQTIPLTPPTAVTPAEPAEAAEHGGPKDVNWTDFGNKDQPPYLAAIINFAILAFIYVYFGKKPIADGLKTRREVVSKQIEEAQKIKHEAEARSKQYAAKLEDLGQELEMTKVALAAAGAGEKARIVREAEEKAARMEKDAVFLLEQERRQVQLDLQREAVHAAVTAAEELLRTKLTAEDQERVAEEFLATLAAPKDETARARAGGGAS